MTDRTHRRALAGALAAALAFGAADAAPRVIDTKHAAVDVETLASGLSHPWSVAFQPEGGMLVTLRSGTLLRFDADGSDKREIGGVPEVHAKGQGGLLDLALHPEFPENRLVYFSIAKPDGDAASTALMRARLGEDRLTDVETLFVQEPTFPNGYHFGGRVVFDGDGHVFMTTGERFKFEPAQDTSNHLGTVVRLNHDGTVPEDNPFVGEDGRDEIWSYGHRNVEGAAIHPDTGALWIAEMGPRGGDEINLPGAGENHGWPVVTWGRHYDWVQGGADMPDHDTRPEFAAPIYFWNPVISPSGMAFYQGSLFPEWEGDAFVGGLSAKTLVRLVVSDDRVLSEERIEIGDRVRDVAVGPDGAVYLLTDQDRGKILRLSPVEGEGQGG